MKPIAGTRPAKTKTFLKKTSAVLLLTVLLVGGLTLPVRTAHAACSPIGGYCITLTSIDPSQPVFGTIFAANARLTWANPGLANGTLTFAVRWKANPSGIADFTSNLAGETSVTINIDASGNGSADLSQAFSSGGSTSGLTLAGPNTVGVKFEVVSGGFSGGPQAFETTPVSFQAPPVSGTARVDINHSVTSAVSGLEVAFEAVYWPAEATASIRDPDLTVNWVFGDGGTATGDYQPNHTYATPGVKTVGVTLLDAAGAVLASDTVTFTLGGNPVTPGGAGALGGAFDTAGGAILFIVNLVLGFIVGFLRWVLNFLANTIFIPLLVKTMTLEATDIAGSAILAGWSLTRDLVNMLFILILIVIGFATILRIEAYNYRRLLVRLILMALLVNFSMVIARIVIDFANVAQFSFLPVAEAGREIHNFYQKIYAPNITEIIGAVNALETSSSLAATMTILFQFTLELGVVITFAAMAIFMLIRTVALWILIILSPFAYALYILPATTGYARMWWSTFIKYVLFAPIIAFFLRLSFGIYENGMGFAGGAGSVTDALRQAGGGTGSVSFQRTLELSLVYIMILCFLWAGLIIARKMGIFGANAIVGLAERGLKAPYALGGRGLRSGASGLTGLAGRSYSKYLNKKLTAAESSGQTRKAAAFRALQFLNPRVAREAWKARSEEKQREAYLPAVGHAHDTLNRVMPTEWHRDQSGKRHLGQKTFYGRIGQRQLINHKMKDWSEANLSEEEKVAAYNGATHAEDKEALNTILLLGRHEDGRAILTALQRREERADQLYNEFMKAGENAEVARQKANTQAGQEIPAQYDSIDDLDTITSDLKHAGLTGEQIGAVLAHNDEVAEAETKIRGLGNAVYEFDGNFRTANDFSGYEKLAKEKGNTEMLQELAKTSLFKVETKTLLDKDGKQVMGADGKPVEVPVKLEFSGQEITDYASLQKAVETTLGADKSQEGKNLGYELTGKRKQMSAQKRIDRGDTEKWGAAFEPAAFMVQKPDGSFSHFTSYGREMYKNLSSATVNTFRRSRRLQARVLKIAGMYRDEQTGQTDLSPKTTNYKVMTDAFELNTDATKAIIDRANLNDYQRDILIEHLTAELNKRGHKFAMRKKDAGRDAGSSIDIAFGDNAEEALRTRAEKEKKAKTEEE